VESEILYQIDRSNVVYEMFDNEVVIINLDNGNYYSYDGVGVEIWNQLTKKNSIDNISQLLSNIYPSVQSDDLKIIINKSIADLENENLLISSKIKNNQERNTSVETNQEIRVDNNGIKTPTLQRFTDMQDFLLVDPIHEIDYEKWPEKNNKKKS
jgi:hypothetical protein